MDDSPREISGERGYKKELLYRENQGKDVVSGYEDKREKVCKNGKEDNFFLLFVCFC